MKILKKTVLFSLSLGTNFTLAAPNSMEFTYELLCALVPYPPVSIRGAVASLRDESYVSVYIRNKQTQIVLSSSGREALRALFPGFSNRVGRLDHAWTVCLFLNAQSKSMPQELRPLREQLLRSGFFSLERGMYVLPKVIPSELIGDLALKKNLNRVLVFETRRLLVGDELQIIRHLFPISRLSLTRQLIGKALDNIGRKGRQKNVLHPQTKLAFATLLPKIMDYFSHDLIVPDLYFPQDIQLSVLKQQLFDVSSDILPKLLLQ